MNPKLVWILRDVPHRYPHQLEARFPHVLERIVQMWGTAQMRRFFDDLMLDTRGDREGFPPEIISEIFALSNYYDSVNPSKSKVDQQWHDQADLDRLERRQK